MRSPFRSRVLDLVRQIPTGAVMGYGDVAAALGQPRAARQVGYALAALPADTDVPWHRVIRHNGDLAMQGDLTRPLLQRARLEQESVPWRGDRVDIERCRYAPSPQAALLPKPSP